MPYAQETDLTVPYAETTDLDRAYRDSAAMRALREVQTNVEHGGYPPVPQYECPGYDCDSPCVSINGRCFWGVPDAEQDACVDGERSEVLPCDAGWWFVRVADAWEGVFALDPADAILLAARKIEEEHRNG